MGGETIIGLTSYIDNQGLDVELDEDVISQKKKIFDILFSLTWDKKKILYDTNELIITNLENFKLDHTILNQTHKIKDPIFSLSLSTNLSSCLQGIQPFTNIQND